MSQPQKANMNVVECKNPFCLEPITLQTQFFGRSKQTRQALNSLHHGQCVSVVGPERIGKTSFLFHVAHPHVRGRRRLAEEQIFVYVDSSSMADLGEAECYLHIREETIRQIKSQVTVEREVGIRLEELVRQAGSQTAHFGLRTLLRSTRQLGLKLVIALDHLDVLNQNRHLQEAFFSGLRSLHNTDALTYIVASRSRIDRLRRICPNGLGSPFFNIFHQISISLFQNDDSRQLVDNLLNLAGARFPDSVKDCILDLGRNEPHRLQRAGYIAFQVWQENQQALREEHCEEVRRRFSKMM
jgi:hypothetical protein